MQIHELSVKKRKDKKTIGRGGKRGTTSGRGMKGQKARSGGNVNPLFEGGRTTLIDKLKKLRGFKSPHAKKVVVTLAVLERNYNDGEEVSVATLTEKKILRSKIGKDGAKIVVKGTLTKKLIINSNVGISKTAKDIVEKAGGTVNVTVAKIEK